MEYGTAGGRAALLALIDASTARFTATVAAMSGPQVGEPSLLPGWTRGHVLAHVARSGEAMTALMAGARTGVPGTGYASPEAREDDIAAGAARPPAEQLGDITAVARAFRAEAQALSDDTARAAVRVLTYPPFPAGQVLLRRLAELELHHVDLALGYTPADWPPEYATATLPEPMNTQRATRH